MRGGHCCRSSWPSRSTTRRGFSCATSSGTGSRPCCGRCATRSCVARTGTVTDAWSRRRPRLAHPFTILTAPGVVRLVAGEDFRYTLTGDGLEAWLPELLRRCTGRESVAELIAGL